VTRKTDPGDDDGDVERRGDPDVARMVREKREAAGMTQQQLADLLRTDRASVGQIETAQRPVSKQLAPRMAEWLGVTVRRIRPRATVFGEADQPYEPALRNRPIATSPAERVVPIRSRITAGASKPQEEQFEGWLKVPQVLARHPETFALRVYGHSMTGAAILDGDVVFLRPPVEPLRNGMIVAAMVDNENALRRVTFEGDAMLLQAQPAPGDQRLYPQMQIVDEDARIQGVYVGLLRSLEGPVR
jgi:SOS-response transcriptional repressor LexA